MTITVASIALLASAPAAATPDYRARLPQDEIIYFVLPDRFENADSRNDRGGLKGDRLKTGFDPTHKGFYHGGDLKGLTKRLDYIQGLGATAIGNPPRPARAFSGTSCTGFHPVGSAGAAGVPRR